MGSFAASLFPPDLTPRFLASLAVPLRQTLAVAAAGTLLGLLLAALLTVPASATVMLRVKNAPGRRSFADGLRTAAYLASRGVLAVPAIPELPGCLLHRRGGLDPSAGAPALGPPHRRRAGKLWAEGLDRGAARSGRGRSRRRHGAGACHLGRAAAGAGTGGELRGAALGVQPPCLGAGGLPRRRRTRAPALQPVQLGFHERVCTLVLDLALVSPQRCAVRSHPQSFLARLRRRVSRPLDRAPGPWVPGSGLEAAR
jgi:hypothetical protein